MVELNHRERTIQIKIVYYGPALGGKTTNLQVLHQHALGSRRGELVSLDSAQDRTILFDLLPLKAAGFRGFDLKLQLLAVPGQAMYAATRKLILKAADALVFVANSAADRQDENRKSFQEMTQNLLTLQLDPATMPLVFQYNKRDLPEVAGIEVLERTLNGRGTESVAAVAIRAEGVLDTFEAILRLTMQDLATRYRMLDLGKGQTVAEWTEKAIEGMFGSRVLPTGASPSSLAKMLESASPASSPAGPAAPAPPPVQVLATPIDEITGRRRLQVVLPAEVAGRAAKGPDARANAALVETYAEASQTLAKALSKTQDEREVVGRRLADLREALGCARDLLAGRPLEPVITPLLGRIVEAARARQAVLLVPEGETTMRLAASWGLAGEDPLLRSKPGRLFLAERPLWDNEPRLHEAADHLDLADALEAVGLGAVVAIPIRTPRALQGIVLLYLTPDGARPDSAELAHLGALAQAVAAPFELAGAIELLHGPEGALGLAALGEACGPSMESILEHLRRLTERFSALKHKTDSPPWLLDELTMSLPELQQVSTTARSLLSMSRGLARRDPIDIEDVWRPLRDPSVKIESPAEVRQIPGDLHLLRLAVAALIARQKGVPGTTIEVRATADPMWIRIGVAASPGNVAPRPNDSKLVLARRVAELHGGGLETEAGGRLTIRLSRSVSR